LSFTDLSLSLIDLSMSFMDLIVPGIVGHVVGRAAAGRLRRQA
jgi:hypothetical protein